MGVPVKNSQSRMENGLKRLKEGSSNKNPLQLLMCSFNWNPLLVVKHSIQ